MGPLSVRQPANSGLPDLPVFLSAPHQPPPSITRDPTPPLPNTVPTIPPASLRPILQSTTHPRPSTSIPIKILSLLPIASAEINQLRSTCQAHGPGDRVPNHSAWIRWAFVAAGWRSVQRPRTANAAGRPPSVPKWHPPQPSSLPRVVRAHGGCFRLTSHARTIVVDLDVALAVEAPKGRTVLRNRQKRPRRLRTGRCGISAGGGRCELLGLSSEAELTRAAIRAQVQRRGTCCPLRSHERARVVRDARRYRDPRRTSMRCGLLRAVFTEN